MSKAPFSTTILAGDRTDLHHRGTDSNCFPQVLGVTFFYNVNQDEDLYGRMGYWDNYVHLDNALWLLHRQTTGEAWNGIMYYCMEVSSLSKSRMKNPASKGITYRKWRSKRCRATCPRETQN